MLYANSNRSIIYASIIFFRNLMYSQQFKFNKNIRYNIMPRSKTEIKNVTEIVKWYKNLPDFGNVSAINITQIELLIDYYVVEKTNTITLREQTSDSDQASRLFIKYRDLRAFDLYPRRDNIFRQRDSEKAMPIVVYNNNEPMRINYSYWHFMNDVVKACRDTTRRAAILPFTGYRCKNDKWVIGLDNKCVTSKDLNANPIIFAELSSDSNSEED